VAVSGVIGVVVGAVIGGTAAWMVGWSDGWDDACDTILKNLEQLNGDDSLTVNLIREIVRNLRGGEHDES
jgi:hypothetical protein